MIVSLLFSCCSYVCTLLIETSVFTYVRGPYFRAVSESEYGIPKLTDTYSKRHINIVRLLLDFDLKQCVRHPKHVRTAYCISICTHG